jgi:formate/nitrite transporter FocA (FNT family)
MGLLLTREPEVMEAADLPGELLSNLDAAGLVSNIGAATLGNIIGGAGLVGLVYWFVYLRRERTTGTGDRAAH